MASRSHAGVEIALFLLVLLTQACIPTLVEGSQSETVAKRKWDENKVSRDESGRFVAQVGHRDNAHMDRYGRDASEFLPQNNFDPTRTQQSDFKPVRPQRTTIFIQSNGKTYRR